MSFAAPRHHSAPRTTRLSTRGPVVVDVPCVDMLTFGPSIDMWHLRSKHFESLCPVSSHYHPVRQNAYEDISPVVQSASPRLITSHCFAIPAAVIGRLAIAHPDVTFLSVCHSSQAHLATNPLWMLSQAEHLDLSVGLPNFYYATPDERMQYAGAVPGSECLHWPNPVRDIDVEPEFPDEPVVSLIGRHDVIKNMPTQILAASLAGVRRLQIVSRPTDAQANAILALCRVYGMEASIEWFSWEDHIQNMATNVSAVLQVSFSESFNYVALEAMLCGKPVIGSPAIRYLPADWQANPDDAEDIAERLRVILNDPARSSPRAMLLGTTVAAQQNSDYRDLIQRLAS